MNERFPHADPTPLSGVTTGVSSQNLAPTQREEDIGRQREGDADTIRIRGARTHNLKNISLDLPRNALVVITGLSGSGKSSLAFDTLYAEGQRRYVESLSTYARQFLQLMEKPDVDLIEGLSPAIAIEQKAASHNPRSTVGTVTEIHDYLRLLYARAGTPHCPSHPDQALDAQSVAQMVDAVLARPQGQRLMILAPVVESRRGEHLELFESLRAQGFARVRIHTEGSTSPTLHELDTLPTLARTQRHSIDVVVDRLKVGPAARQRLAESFETALRLAQGRAIVTYLDEPSEVAMSNRFACPQCAWSLPSLEPRLFSFNNPAGACPGCDGLGQVSYFDPKRVVQFPQLSLASGAIRGWDRRNAFFYQMLQSLSAYYQFDLETAWEALPETIQQVILEGSGSVEIPFTYLSERAKPTARIHPFEGVLPNLERRWKETDSSTIREELGKFRNIKSCPSCAGTRLRAEARFVLVAEQPIAQVSHWTLGQALTWFEALHLPGSKATVGERIVREIASRLRFLVNVGLDYLSLDRPAETLSGGESQRIRLASQIGSGLTGVMYVLDEPSIGLHQRDNDRLIATLRHLRNLGNSVLVVEHDEDTIRACDHVVDLGPGPGIHGGRIVAQGTAQAIARNPDSLTGQYLAGTLRIPMPGHRRPPDPQRQLMVRGARGNNLRGIDVAFPVGLLTCITGVSGSGKSSLVNDTVLAAVTRHLHASSVQAAAHDSIEGLEHFDKVIAIDQSPIGRTPRSNPATYTGLFTPIRELFAESTLARERGYGPGRFSFNVRDGRCEACEGDGVLRVEMHFLPDLYVPCDTCNGKRYNRETLEVQWKGSNIAQVLDMTVEQAQRFFAAVPAIARKLDTLMEVGLGYLRLGQSATTLSGGEAQRVKLSQELSKRDTGRTLYVLDEPTTGLHFHDIAQLLKVLQRLAEHGNTLLVIEHNLDVIKTADWVIDLGPEGGAGGGLLLGCGTPEDLARLSYAADGSVLSYTGVHLARTLLRASAAPD
jgi:excinuclease ABC subunit A